MGEGASSPPFFCYLCLSENSPSWLRGGMAFRPGAFDDYYSYALRRRLRLLLVPLILE